ncbi:helix-turn-helix domain-containing protein [Gayadomonas joobiniege]|uniref:helix-turn-helix domain-containing protein n=1 Tax=Gayadomonas joobiniege TaxID=1234606 RepID=UPI00036043A8|nr:helix-turn-helix transcriptional regulator [Gayadomonas joobiniege]
MQKPVYKSDHLRFEIDNCLPQMSAVKDHKIEMHALTHGNYPGRELSETQLSGISSMGFMHVVGEQDWGISPHRNEGIEICFQENGTNVLRVDGDTYQVPSKTLTITRPWQLHQVGDPNLSSGRLHWIIIDVGVRSPNQSWQWPSWCILTEVDKQELEDLLRRNETPVWQANNDILNVFKRLQASIVTTEVEREISQLQIQLNQLLLNLLQLLRSKNIALEDHLTSKARSVEIFLDELKNNYKIAGFEWTLDLMAEHCQMARSAFSNYCQQLSNSSPILYLMHCRLEHAARLLVDKPGLSVTDLAYDLGFSNSQYFSRCFKQKYGCPPLRWRKNNLPN